MDIICGLSSRNFRTNESHNCICPKCNKKFPIYRKKSNRREKHHKKDIWCPFCQEMVTMTEVY